MKRIEAIIKPFKIEEVREAVVDLGIHGLTVTEVQGYGSQKSSTEIYHGGEPFAEPMGRVKVDLVVSEDQVQSTVRAILQAARTGRLGDGKIFVSHVEQVVRIRTGERDQAAL